VSIDVVVVGGGIVGAAATAGCARRGMSVTLCERGALASGASNLDLALIPAELPAAEYLELHHFTGRAFFLDRSPPDGWPARRIGARAATAALAAEARSYGATVRTGCDVKALLVRADAVRGVLTDDGELAADVVVVAAGLDTARLCATAGVSWSCQVEAGTVVVADRPPGWEEAPVVDGEAWAALDAAGRVVVADPAALPGLEDLRVLEQRLLELPVGDPGTATHDGLLVAAGVGRWGIARAPAIAAEIATRIAAG
jgi:glycine/D-amino acid oxidase-like deaminating enzyme